MYMYMYVCICILSHQHSDLLDYFTTTSATWSKSAHIRHLNSYYIVCRKRLAFNYY